MSKRYATMAQLMGDSDESARNPSEFGLTSTVEMIDAEKATEYLKLNHPNNRNLRRDRVRSLANDMNTGNWMQSGDPIRFDTDGHLIDGQHRLAALVTIDAKLPFLVLRGVAPNAIHVIDTGAARRPMDALKIAGHNNTALLAGAARVLYRLKAGPLDGSRVPSVSHSALLEMVERHPALRESCMKPRAIRGIRPSLLVTMHYVSRLLDVPERGDAFIAVFNTGIPDYAGDPAHMLRERWLHERGAVVRSTDSHTLVQIAHVWNHFAKQRAFRQLKFPASVEIEGLDLRKI